MRIKKPNVIDMSGKESAFNTASKAKHGRLRAQMFASNTKKLEPATAAKTIVSTR